MLGLSCAALMCSGIYADWLDDLITLVGPVERWQAPEAESLLETYLQEDEARVQKIEKKLKTVGSGFWAAVHYSGYKAELLNAWSEKRYHEKLLKAFQELPDNKKDREKLVQSLATLHRYGKELEELKKEYEKAQGVSEKTKLWARIKAKQTQVLAKRSFIKSSFLIS